MPMDHAMLPHAPYSAAHKDKAKHRVNSPGDSICQY